MKKILLLIVSSTLLLCSCATNTMDLDKQIVNCNSESGTYTVRSKATASEVIANCKTTKQDSKKYMLDQSTLIQFNATITTPVVCEYNAGVLDRCTLSK